MFSASRGQALDSPHENGAASPADAASIAKLSDRFADYFFCIRFE
jgi:hypothetical protein